MCPWRDPAANPASGRDRSAGRASRLVLGWLGICAIVLTLGWLAGQAGGTVRASGGAGPYRAGGRAATGTVRTGSLLSLTAPGRAAAIGTGTIVVSPTSVLAAETTTLTFTYTANLLDDGTLTLTVPPGWTPPSLVPGPGYTTVSCPAAIRSAPPCQLAVGAMTITVSNAYRDVDFGQTVTISYQMARAPATGGTSTFTTTEQDSPSVTPISLADSPAVMVTCPDGAGTMTVSPLQVTASHTGTLTFSYTAGSCGTEAGGLVELTVPAGWPAPVAAAGGNTTWTGSGTLSTSGQTVTAPAGNLAPGQTFMISYGPVQAPAAAQAYVFGAQEQSATGGTLTPLPGPPTVTVVTPPPLLLGGEGTITVSPARAVAGRASTLTFTYTAPGGGLPATGEVTVQVPAGWTAPVRTPGRAGYASSSGGLLSVSGRRITVTGVALPPGQHLVIDYAAGIAPRTPGASTFVTSERPDGSVRLAALRQSPSVTVIPAGPPSRPSSSAGLFLLIGLAIAVVAAGALAAHLLRRGGQVTAVASVRAVPHAGPPAMLAVRDTGTRPTLTVRIEPHASTAVTTIKESRP